MKDNNNLISVIIPTYNQAFFLQRAISSVIKQTYNNWEIIVVDNQSTDNTVEVIRAFEDNRIFLYKINNFGVVAASRNLGIKCARGAYIAFLDSDDWWVESKLQKCIQAIDLGYNIIYHKLWFVTNATKSEHPILPSRKLKEPIFKDLLFKGNTLPNSSVVVNRQILFKVGLIDENKDIIASEDYDLWLKVSRVTESFIEINECLGYYWFGGLNLSKSHNLAIAGKIILDKYKNELSNLEYCRSEGFLLYSSGLHQIRNSNFTQARVNFLGAINKGVWGIKIKAFYRLLMSFA